MTSESTKYVRLPNWLPYPVQIEASHFTKNQSVMKGEPLYTLRDASGKRGVMRSPLDAVVVGAPLEVGAAFDAPVPIVGLRVPSQQAASQTSETANKHRVGETVDQRHHANKKAAKDGHQGRMTEVDQLSHQKASPEQTSSKVPDLVRAKSNREPSQISPDEHLEQAFRGRLTFSDKEAKTLSLEGYREFITQQLATAGHEVTERMVLEKVNDWRLEANWLRVQAGDPFKGMDFLVRPPSTAHILASVLLAAVIGGAAYYALRLSGWDPVAMPDNVAMTAIGGVAIACTTLIFLASSKSLAFQSRFTISTAIALSVVFGVSFLPTDLLEWHNILGDKSTARYETNMPTNPALELVDLESLASRSGTPPSLAEQQLFDSIFEEF